jgi:hypothetical protein
LTEETALPTGAQAEAGEQAQTTAAAAATTTEQVEQPAAEAKPEGEQTAEQKEAKKEKTPEQREIERLRRRVDNLTRQKYEARAQAGQPEARVQETQASNDEPVTLSRAELQKMIAEQAQKLAPTISEQKAEIERRHGIVQSLAKTWGQEEFDAKASDLEAAFSGLADAQGRPKPATDAIFEADDPKAVIEYLTDPDNADEAERIAKLPAGRAGREILKLELKLKEEAAKAKPKPSNAAKPLEAVKGGGVPTGMPDPSNTKAYIAWANAQERAAR